MMGNNKLIPIFLAFFSFSILPPSLDAKKNLDVGMCLDLDHPNDDEASIKKGNEYTKACCSQVKLDCKVGNSKDDEVTGKSAKYNVCVNMNQDWPADKKETLKKHIMDPMDHCCNKFNAVGIAWTVEDRDLEASCQ